MTTTLRDAMAAASINRMKTRVAKSWGGDDEPKAPASASHLN